MKEKLQEYALIAEIVSTLAIISSLIFVGLQIRQNSDTVKAQTRNAIAEIARDNVKATMDPRLIEAFLKMSNGVKLTPEEAFLIRLHNNLIFRTAENVYYQYNIGTFSEDEFDGYRNYFHEYFSNKITLENWEETKSGYSPRFREEMDALISDIK